MNSRYGALPSVDQQDGHAISRLRAQKQARDVANRSITVQRLGGNTLAAPHNVRMDLFQCDNGKSRGAQRRLRAAAIF
ncbi:MAG: hypothetical protein NVS9B4_10660 [Candidatus Acidiferrum sp.]